MNNREYKFRVWNKLSKVLYPWNSAKDWKISLVEDGKFVYQQSTALKDKDGKDIYEGDFLKDINTNLVHKVYWNDDAAGFEMTQYKVDILTDYDPPTFHSKYCHRFEIVGNIFENPELIKP